MAANCPAAGVNFKRAKGELGLPVHPPFGGHITNLPEIIMEGETGGRGLRGGGDGRGGSESFLLDSFGSIPTVQNEGSCTDPASMSVSVHCTLHHALHMLCETTIFTPF